jgi:hypothetical protein
MYCLPMKIIKILARKTGGQRWTCGHFCFSVILPNGIRNEERVVDSSPSVEVTTTTSCTVAS